MTTESHPLSPTPPTGRTRLPIGTAALVVILILSGIYLVSIRQQTSPNNYLPAHSAMTDAALILSESYNDEKALRSRFQSAHHLLDNAIALLDRAEKLDPADKREIDTLRVRLKALEDPDRVTALDTPQLKRSYHELILQLNSLAKKLEQQETQSR